MYQKGTLYKRKRKVEPITQQPVFFWKAGYIVAIKQASYIDLFF
jgi:hypothetical protein